MIRNNINPLVQKPEVKIPIHSVRLWLLLAFGLVLIMGLSMLKDWWLTEDEPNIWFYIFMPIIDIVGTAFVMFLVARLFQQMPKFLEYLAINWGVAIVMQSSEIITKLIYYKVWEYPGWLYLVFVFPLWFVITSYALVHYTRLKWRMALLISTLGLIGSLVIGITLSELTGLQTPGS